MADETDELQRRIQFKREELGQNFEELEHKVKRAMDWHSYVEQYPMTAVALSFSGGVLLSMLVNGHRKSPSARRYDWRQEPSRTNFAEKPRRTSEAREKLGETLDVFKGALIGIATAKLRDMMSDVVPGFQEHYEKAKRKKEQVVPNGHSPEPTLGM
jgi:hypothetical protein